jgi:hypothetical protein
LFARIILTCASQHSALTLALSATHYFALPVLVMGAFLVVAIKIGELNGSIKSIYYELQHVRKNALSDQLADQIRKLYAVRQSLKLFLIYYGSGFAYLVFLLFLRDILDLAKDRHHTPT